VDKLEKNLQNKADTTLEMQKQREEMLSKEILERKRFLWLKCKQKVDQSIDEVQAYMRSRSIK
jgi:hypothetical protein